MQTPEQLAIIYEKNFSALDPKCQSPAARVEFYPYVGVTSRIRLREGILHVRISDLLREAPTEFHESLALILVGKLLRKRIPATAEEIYRSFIKGSEIREKSAAMRRARGRKILSGSKGAVYDLDDIFTLLNDVYFDGKLPKPVLSWSAQKTFRILGHHDSAHRTIVISRSLDEKSVPRFVVEYVVYHEMLHVKHPTVHHNGRRYNHTPVFRRDEEEFAFFREAEEWIEQNAHALKRKAKRK